MGWGERGRSVSLTDGTGTSTALLSPHKTQSRVGFFVVVVALKV